MKKQYKRVLIFIGLKLAELTGLAMFIAALVGLNYLTDEYDLAKYIFIAISLIIIAIWLVIAVKENWAWAGRIAGRKK
jgi:thiosulfate reductase cytochrome b subunit